MNLAAPMPHREEIDGQWLGYWLDGARPVPSVRPSYRPTGAILRRNGESESNDFICLDLVLVETNRGTFQWLPLSEAGRYTYAHSIGLLQNESWRFGIWDDSKLRIYQASYDVSLDHAEIASLYGVVAQQRARPDRPIVQLRLRRVSE